MNGTTPVDWPVCPKANIVPFGTQAGWDTVVFHCRQATLAMANRKYTAKEDEIVQPLTDKERGERRATVKAEIGGYIPNYMTRQWEPSWAMEDITHAYVERNFIHRHLHASLCSSRDQEFEELTRKEVRKAGTIIESRELPKEIEPTLTQHTDSYSLWRTHACNARTRHASPWIHTWKRTMKIPTYALGLGAT